MCVVDWHVGRLGFFLPACRGVRIENVHVRSMRGSCVCCCSHCKEALAQVRHTTEEKLWCAHKRTHGISSR